ncbi:MAG: LysR family transcriptional regulator [Acidimicrobiia bacterium]|nr:LysR family transcriptional regulator [Acidimicrobiia bacterium]
MELRHLETLLAIEAEGSFTAAADALHTVQSNVSEQVRQIESELGVPLLTRSRKGATPTEFGMLVLDRARRIRQEIDALHLDLSMIQGLETGHAGLGVVGTISRWLVPAVVADMRLRAAGVSLRVSEGASERLAVEVADRTLAQAVLTEPVDDARLVVEPLRDEELVALLPVGLDLGHEAPVPLAVLAQHPMVLPPVINPLRREIDDAARAEGITLKVPLEVEGVRLILDLVAAGVGVAIMPATAVPPDDPGLQTLPIVGMPPRRLALVTARGVRLSLADQAVREVVIGLVRSPRE